MSDILVELQRIPSVRKTYKKIYGIFDTINSVMNICENGIGNIENILNTVGSLKNNSGIISSGFELLGILPDGVDIEGSLNESFNFISEKVSYFGSITKNCIYSITEYLNTLNIYIEKGIRKAQEYYDNIETVIKSTINKYSSIIFNCYFSINKIINKIQTIFNKIVNLITSMPSILMDNVMTKIKNKIDLNGKKFKVGSSLLQPIINQVLSSITSSVVNSISGITDSFNQAFGKINRIMDIISDYIGKVNGNLLWSCR